MDDELLDGLREVAADLEWDVKQVTERLSPYELLAKRAAGGLALLADAHVDDEPVVLKLPRRSRAYDPSPRMTYSVRMLRYEGSVLRALGPVPHLVELREFRDDEEFPFIALEPLGRGLDVATPSGGLPLADCLEVTAHVASALEVFHAADLIKGADLTHGDLNPANILEGPDGWTLIDPSHPDLYTEPFTDESELELGWRRDILALGRTFMTTYVGRTDTDVPGDLGVDGGDEALLVLLERMLGKRGYDAIPTAAEVLRVTEQTFREIAPPS